MIVKTWSIDHIWQPTHKNPALYRTSNYRMQGSRLRWSVLHSIKYDYFERIEENQIILAIALDIRNLSIRKHHFEGDTFVMDEEKSVISQQQSCPFIMDAGIYPDLKVRSLQKIA